MPYTIHKVGRKWEVRSPNGLKGTHSTKKEALAQQRAIYANAKDEPAVKTSPKKARAKRGKQP